MMVCITDFSLWFSLPTSIWLTAGWVGLIVHWQAISKWPASWKTYPSNESPIAFNLSVAELNAPITPRELD
jgi:hypothetical protein